MAARCSLRTIPFSASIRAGLRDRYADYFAQNRAHALINRAHCIANPNGFAGYGADCWGLTACDGDAGYNAFSPTNDHGVIAPTAALASMPYTPDELMAALRCFYEELGGEIWREHGFADSFNRTRNWVAPGHLAIDQGPIVVMIENHRSGLLWDLFMSCDEVRTGLARLGFAAEPADFAGRVNRGCQRAAQPRLMHLTGKNYFPGAAERTRTSTVLPAATSRQCVYQFRHGRMGEERKAWYRRLSVPRRRTM